MKGFRFWIVNGIAFDPVEQLPKPVEFEINLFNPVTDDNIWLVELFLRRQKKIEVNGMEVRPSSIIIMKKSARRMVFSVTI